MTMLDPLQNFNRKVVEALMAAYPDAMLESSRILFITPSESTDTLGHEKYVAGPDEDHPAIKYTVNVGSASEPEMVDITIATPIEALIAQDANEDDADDVEDEAAASHNGLLTYFFSLYPELSNWVYCSNMRFALVDSYPLGETCLEPDVYRYAAEVTPDIAEACQQIFGKQGNVLTLTVQRTEV